MAGLRGYGFDPPTHAVVLEMSDGGEKVLFIGRAVPDTENRWYACGVDERGGVEDEYVYIVGKAVRDAVAKPFGDLAETKLRDIPPENVTQVSLIDADRHIMLDRIFGYWTVVKPAGVTGIKQNAIEALLKSVSTIVVDDLVDAEDAAGLDNPARRIVVTRLDGEAFELRVGSAVPNRDEQYFARINGDGRIFAIKLSTLEKMQPPLNELADLRLFAGEVTAVRVHTPEREFDGDVAHVADLTAVDVKEASRVQDPELDAGATWFDVTADGATVRVTVGAMDAGHRPLRLSDRPTVWYVRAPDVGRILGALGE